VGTTVKIETGDPDIDKHMAELPEHDRARVMYYVEALRHFVKAGGAHALVALAVVGTEEGNKK
jgi:hypothetical protein